MAEKMWSHVKELLTKSCQIVSHQTEPDVILHLIDIAESFIIDHRSFCTAKL